MLTQPRQPSPLLQSNTPADPDLEGETVTFRHDELYLPIVSNDAPELELPEPTSQMPDPLREERTRVKTLPVPRTRLAQQGSQRGLGPPWAIAAVLSLVILALFVAFRAAPATGAAAASPQDAVKLPTSPPTMAPPTRAIPPAETGRWDPHVASSRGAFAPPGVVVEPVPVPPKPSPVEVRMAPVQKAESPHVESQPWTRHLGRAGSTARSVLDVPIAPPED